MRITYSPLYTIGALINQQISLILVAEYTLSQDYSKMHISHRMK